MPDEGCDFFSARFIAAKVEGAFRGGFVVVSVYLKDGLKGSGVNLEILRVLGEFLTSCGCPWVAGGDWNMNPLELRRTGWLQQVSGELVAPEECTCTCGEGDVLDYFVVSAGLRSRCKAAKVWADAPCSPHSPVVMVMEQAARADPIVQRVMWKAFPAKPLIGRSREAAPVEWSWEIGAAGLDLAGSWREWLGNAEGCLCREFDLVGKEAEAYCGRAAGFTTKVVPFDLVSKAAKSPRTTKLARAWKGLQALWRRACLVAGRVAKGGRGRRELDEIRVSMGAMGGLGAGV
jgi:hypothetical protein